MNQKDSRWKAAADDVLREVFDGLDPAISAKDLRRLLVEAYPFGERRMWPYRCWCLRQRAWIAAFRAGRLPPVEVRGVLKVDKETLDLLP